MGFRFLQPTLHHRHDGVGRDQSVSLLNEDWLYTNLAHALMFLNRVDDAQSIYLQRRGEKLGNKSWEDTILEHFSELRRAGLSHP